MLSDDYTKEATKNVKIELKNSGETLKNNVKDTMASGYCTELGVSP